MAVLERPKRQSECFTRWQIVWRSRIEALECGHGRWILVGSIVVYGCGCLWSIPIWSDDPQSTFIYLHTLLIIHVSSFFTQNLCQGSMPPSVV